MDNNFVLSFSLQGINIILTVLVGVYVVQLKAKFDKQIKSFEYDRKEIGELRTKIHDRMTEAIKLIKQSKIIDEKLALRIRMTSSRFNMYDKSEKILPKVETFINGWNMEVLSTTAESGYGNLSKKRANYIYLAEEIKKMSDEIIKSL